VKIIYEDAEKLIVEKPAGMLTQSARSFDTDLVSEVLTYRRSKKETAYAAVINRLGSLLLTEAQSYVTAKNAAKIGISAQVRAAGFYETLGFVRQGEEYLEENCPHIYMEKTL
jgi:predicted GNAT family N-acyltransferase